MAYIKYGLVSDGNGTWSDFSDPSYTVRSFNYPQKDVLINKYDIQYHTYYQNNDGTWKYSDNYYYGTVTPSTASVFSKNQENWFYPSITQSSLDPLTQSYLDTQNQYQLSTGNPVSPNADGKYNSGISVNVNGTLELVSSAEDNLLASGFDDPGTYYIQMPLWSLPGTSVSPTLNRSLSSITFSSSDTFSPSATVTIPFNSSELELPFDDPTTTDELWRIDRDVLINNAIVNSGSVDLSNVKRIKMTLVSSGGAITFKTGQMKMVPSAYSHYYANVDNKTGLLKREDWPTISQNNLPVLLQDGIKIKNFSYIAKLHLDSVPVSGNHEFSMFGRVNPNFEYNPSSPTSSTNSYLRSKLLIGPTSCTINLYEDCEDNLDNVVFTITRNSILTSGDYYFITTFQDDHWEAQFFSAPEENFIKDIILETGTQTISNAWLSGDNISPFNASIGKGYAGYQMKPNQYGNFYLDYIYSKNAIIAEYESKTFNSYSPVTGVSLFTNAVPDLNLFSSTLTDFKRVVDTNNFNYSGKSEVGFIAEPQNAEKDDVVVEEDTQIVYSNKSLKITKKKNARIAAIKYSSKLQINDFSKLIFKAKLRYNDILNKGDFKVVFWNEDRTRVLYIQDIKNLIPNDWNDIEIPIYSNKLYNNKFIFEIGHYGQIDPVPPITDPYGWFWIEQAELTLESIEWEASNNGGASYVPFLTAINDKYNTINFASQNYYTSLLNKNPYILWEFNDIRYDTFFTGGDGRDKISGALYTSSGTVLSYQHLINTPGSVVAGSAYVVPASVNNYYSNKAVAIYGGTNSYVTTSNSETLNQIFGIDPSTPSDITSSIRFYTDTTGNTINLLSCQGTATGSWKMDISSTANLVFTALNVGTVTATIPFSTKTGFTTKTWDDKDWHTASFSYDSTDNLLSLYWDGKLIKTQTLSTDLKLNSIFSIFGPAATTPHNSWNSFNSTYPFLFVDNVSVHKEVLSQKELFDDNIAADATYNQLKIRARAYTKNAWLVGYEAIPHYAKLGRLREIQSQSKIIFNTAIFDQSTFGID
jgi:hypothetical protein